MGSRLELSRPIHFFVGMRKSISKNVLKPRGFVLSPAPRTGRKEYEYYGFFRLRSNAAGPASNVRNTNKLERLFY